MNAAREAAAREAAKRRHPSNRNVRYCTCGHAEQFHADDGCRIIAPSWRNLPPCPCDKFSPGVTG